VLRSTPHPAVPSLTSPVPTYTISGFTGSMAMEPVTSEHSVSVSGTQLAPSLVLFHTPPADVPAYSVKRSVGWNASAGARPDSSCGSEP